MKKLFIIWLMLLANVCYADLSLVGVPVVEGDALHTMQSGWIIADSENSADTQTDALSDTERTKLLVDALIAANASNEAFISVVPIPPKWNAVRLRGIGITDGGNRVDEIYLGTLGRQRDCMVTYAASLDWTIGLQRSIYSQITFTSGGTYEPIVGDKITGNTSTETAYIQAISALSSGTWAGGDAAGTITYTSASGTFTNSETVTISRENNNKSLNGYTHAASDVIHFELADTLENTPKSWGSTWTTTSPADNTNAETEVDVKGADIMIVVTTTSSVDTKLLVKGY